MMYEGENANTIDLLYEKPTEERNGTKVVVPVNYSDRWEFVNKIKEQLAYFRDVYFNVNITGDVIGEFKIYESEDFIVSTLSTDDSLHICLDNVYYPIEFNKLGIARIDSGIALKFSLTDGIIPTPNRESIRYTPESKVIILNKIKKVANHLITRYNTEVDDYDDIHSLFMFYGDGNIYLNVESLSVKLNGFDKHSDVDLKIPTFKGVSLINIKEINKSFGKEVWLSEYYNKYNLQYGKIREAYRQPVTDSQIYSQLYILEGSFNNILREYVRSNHRHDNRVIVEKMKSIRLKSKFSDDISYMRVLQLDKHPKSEWRQRIQEFQLVRDSLVAKFVILNKNTIPQTWLDNRKMKMSYRRGRASIIHSPLERRVKVQGEVIGKVAEPLLRYISGQNCKFTSDTMTLEKIPVSTHVIIYDKHDNAGKLDKLFTVINKRFSVKLMTFSDRELKIISKADFHNLISYKEFMEGKHIIFRRIVTAFLISKLMGEQSNVFEKFAHLSKVSKPLANDVELLSKYKLENYVYGDTSLYEDMVKIAEENNWFDGEAYSVYLRVKSTLEKFTFINSLLKHTSRFGYTESTDGPLITAIVKLCKYEKFRVNSEHYNISINN